jgi:hypothetical protein
MDMECEHASIIDKRISSFAQIVIEISDFFLGKVAFGLPRIYYQEKILISCVNKYSKLLQKRQPKMLPDLDRNLLDFFLVLSRNLLVNSCFLQRTPDFVNLDLAALVANLFIPQI